MSTLRVSEHATIASSALATSDFLSLHQAQTNQNLAELLQDQDMVPPELQSIYTYTLMGSSAKRVRPSLAYAIGEALDVEPTDLHGLAVGTELAHTATVIMDDLPGQDNEPSRRGKDAAHIRFGVGPIEVASLHMALTGIRVVSAADSEHKLNGALTSLAARQISLLCPGQILDLATFQGSSPTEIRDVQELDAIAALKTSPLMEMPTVGAALIGGQSANSRVATLLRRYSHYYGIAFQVQDDIVDAQQDTGHIDKPTYVSLLKPEGAQSWLEHNAGLADAALESLSAEIDTTRLREVIAYIGESANHH